MTWTLQVRSEGLGMVGGLNICIWESAILSLAFPRRLCVDPLNKLIPDMLVVLPNTSDIFFWVSPWLKTWNVISFTLINSTQMIIQRDYRCGCFYNWFLVSISWNNISASYLYRFSTRFFWIRSTWRIFRARCMEVGHSPGTSWKCSFLVDERLIRGNWI